jgi:hypothetical protein
MPGLIEHRPWLRQEKYSLGIEGQRIAIVGHSHWQDPDNPKDVDSDDYTVDVLHQVIDGTCRPPFFPHIRGYFGWPTNDFWNHVMFFN